jgi:hypothetical protein
MMDYQSFVAAGLVGAYLLVRSPRRLRDSGMALLGALPPGLALAAYHTACFGGPLKTGYALSNTVHEQGFLGLVGPSAESFRYTLIDPSNGLLVLMPWVVLAVVGGVAVFCTRESRRRAGAEAVVCLLVFAGYLLFMGSLVPSFSRAGWCVGPRYMTVALPFIAWLAVAGFALFDRWLVTRVVAQTAVVASMIIFVLAATVYPHWPDSMTNPLYELLFPLLRQGYAPHSLGTLVRLKGLASLVPLYLFVVGFVFWLLARPTRRGRAATAVAFALAALVIVGYRFFPRSGPPGQRSLIWVMYTWEPPVPGQPK